MSTNNLKYVIEILDEYFEKLRNDTNVDADLRLAISELWAQKKLYTTTHLLHVLDELRIKKSK